MLPELLIKELDLKHIGISDYMTASGQEKSTEVYVANTSFLGEEREVAVLSTKADFALAGMELFHNSRITIERYKGFLEITKPE